jgi:hypothetical protein
MIQFLNDHWLEISAFAGLLSQLIRSELMALDQTTMANGIIHGRRLARKALTVKLVPEDSSPNVPAG